MKTFKLVGMALIAILLSVNFTSCSKDDGPTEEEEGNEVVVNEKKLVKISSITGSENYGTITFKYDNNGRLIEAIEKDDDIETTQYIWGDDAIKVIWKRNSDGYTNNDLFNFGNYIQLYTKGFI